MEDKLKQMLDSIKSDLEKYRADWEIYLGENDMLVTWENLIDQKEGEAYYSGYIAGLEFALGLLED